MVIRTHRGSHRVHDRVGAYRQQNRRMINDAHCHFFSNRFFTALSAQRGRTQSVPDLCRELGWEPPESPEALAARWIKELDANSVARAALIASIPGDEESVAAAVSSHPSRFV